MRYASVVLTLLLGVTLAACHDATGPTSDLAAARIRWAQRGPDSYQQQQNDNLASARFDPTLGYPVHITEAGDPALDAGGTTDVQLSALPQMSVR